MDYFAAEVASRADLLSYANEIARNVLTPGDICLKNSLICLCQSWSLSGRETAKPPYPPPYPAPRRLTWGLSVPAASGSAPLIALERYEAGGIRVSCRSASWDPRPQVLWQDSRGWQLLSHREDTTLDENGLFAVESSIILTRGVTQELPCSLQHVPHRLEQGSAL